MKLAYIGLWGHHYLRELLRPGVSPVPIEAAAAGDGRDSEAAQRWAAKHGVQTWFDDPLILLEEFKPDAVSIGAVYAHNGDLIAECLRRNITTVSDKPVAATWGQLGRLRELASDRKRILLTEFDFRCKPEFRAAEAAIAQGLIGQVVLATAQKSYRFGTRPAWYADRQQYGGTLLWIAGHGIDAVEWVTGRRIRRVIGRQGNISKPDFGTMEDHLAILMELDGGATGVVHADFLRPAAAATHGDDRLRIAGSRGLLEVRGERCTLTTDDAAEMDITDRAAGVQPMHLELLSASRGRESRWFSTDQSLRTAEILLHARDAADGQCWVNI